MAIYKVTYVSNVGKAGESETWYWNSTANYSTFLADVRRLLDARLRLLASDARLKGARIAQLDAPGPKANVPELEIGLPPAANPKVDYPTLGPLIDFYDSASIGRRSQILRFVPGSAAYLPWTSANPISPTPGGAFTTALGRFYLALGLATDGKTPGGPAQGRWGIRRRKRINTGAQVSGVFDATPDADNSGRWDIAVHHPPGNLPYVAGDRIHVHGATGCGTSGLNGDATIVKVISEPPGGPNTYEISRHICCPGDVDYKGDGLVYLIEYEFIPFDHAKYSRTVDRKVGRPFVGTRGRQRKRCGA